MPELARFFGIIIRMFAEPAAPHQRPHFHAYYQNHTAVFSIDSIELLSGTFRHLSKSLVLLSPEGIEEFHAAMKKQAGLLKHLIME